MVTIALCIGMTSVLTGCKMAAVTGPSAPYAGKHDGLTAEELAVEKVLLETAAMPTCVEYFSPFFSTAYLIVEEFNALCFTAVIRDGKMTIKRGVKPDVWPDLVIPMTKQNCLNVRAIFDDGVVTEEEEYRIVRTTFAPSCRSILQRTAMQTPRLMKLLKVPDFVHVQLTNSKGFSYNNTTRPLTVTIVRIDSQWLVFEGASGIPDIRMELSVENIKEITRMAATSSAKKGLSREDEKALRTLMEKATVWRREDG